MNNSIGKLDTVLNQVKSLATSASESTRKDIMSSLRNLANSLEAPDDTMERIMFLHLQVAAVRAAIDLKLFQLLADSQTPLSVEQLAQETGAAPLLLARLLRYLASIGDVEEVGKNTFTSNSITKTLAKPGNQAGVIHYFDTVGPMFQEMPAFLKKIKYQDITDNTNTVLQDAFHTDLPVFLWLPSRPEAWNQFNLHMAARREGMPTWLSVYPVEEETKNWDPAAPLWVDIGGGIGHQCAELKAKHPNIPGRVILQDLPHCIDHAIPTPGVEAMVHDFFTPNPIKGAKFYYMRGILHDFPADKARVILQNIMISMGKDSVILIDDMVLPETHAHWQATQVDLTMMCALAAMERTTEQWQALLDSVGLKLVKTYIYTPSCHESVTVAVPKERA